MAAGTTRISDIIVPEIFTPYVQQMTQEKSRLIQSGAVVLDDALSNALAGGGLTFSEPSFRDLDNDTDNVSSDDPAVNSSPNKIGTSKEVQVRLSRNNSWSSTDLAAALAGADPVEAIANRISNYWVRRDQAMFVATIKGIFAMNAAAPANGSTHVQNDMTFDVSGSAFSDGVTNLTTEAFTDAVLTMGDSMDDLSLVFMHSIVYARALKNNLIDFIPDSVNMDASPYAAPGRSRGIPTYQGRIVIVDDGVPFTVTGGSGVFETWIFGAGAVRMGVGLPKVPTEVDRKPAAGNGGGQDVIHSRIERIFHPVGHAYRGTAPNGGPDNTANTNMLAAAGSWIRVFPERKQIRIARLITREY